MATIDPRLNQHAKNGVNGNNASFDHLVYVRVFEGCNLHCKHCFIPHNPKKMSLDNIKNIHSHLKKFAKPGETVLLQWHGGEPTIFGPEWFGKALEILDGVEDYNIIHGIQTNLMTYDSRWRDLYKQYFNSSIGVSWDPKIRLLRKDKDSSSQDYEEKFWLKLKELIDDEIDPYLVVTGTKVFFEHFKNPFDFFDLLLKHQIKYAHIERLTKTGFARSNWEDIGLSNLEHSKYMARFARAYFTLKNKGHYVPLNISPFDSLFITMENLVSGREASKNTMPTCLSGICDTRFHTIDQNGYKAGCTALTSEYDNVNAKNMVKFESLTDLRNRRQADCHHCNFKKICSSGCLASRYLDESGECSGNKQLFNAIKEIVTINLETRYE